MMLFNCVIPSFSGASASAAIPGSPSSLSSSPASACGWSASSSLSARSTAISCPPRGACSTPPTSISSPSPAPSAFSSWPICSFIRFLPVIAIAEVRSVLPEADPHDPPVVEDPHPEPPMSEMPPSFVPLVPAGRRRSSTPWALNSPARRSFTLPPRRCATSGFQWWDCYTPYYIHGLDKAMGLRKSLVGLFTLGGGLAGLIGGFLLITITSVYVYPMDTQGKPYFSLPGFVPILDLLTIILSAIMSIVGMVMLCLSAPAPSSALGMGRLQPRHARQVLHRHRGQRPAFQRKSRRSIFSGNRRHQPHPHRRGGGRMKLRYFFLAVALWSSSPWFRSPVFAAIISPKPPFEIFPDMNYQDKVKDQLPSTFFSDGNCARAAHSRHRRHGNARARMITGRPANGTTRHWGDGIPVHDARRRRTSRSQIDAANMARGRERYTITCSVCHGAVGRRQRHHLQVRHERRGQLSQPTASAT